MLIHEVAQASGLTKKAVEYYTEKGLVQPKILENNYRDYDASMLETLKRIKVLRDLGLAVEVIAEILADDAGTALAQAVQSQRMKLDQAQQRYQLLQELIASGNYTQTAAALAGLESKQTIAERLRLKFPGYYGQFISYHFERFLGDPIESAEQQQAYEELIEFFDNAPRLEFTPELQQYLADHLPEDSEQLIREMTKNTEAAIDDPEQFLQDHQAMLEAYQAFKQSQEYLNSPAYQIQQLLHQFIASSGYTKVFIPAMRRLSPSYRHYYAKLEAANEVLLAHYPPSKASFD